jgi:hypothetical protein
MRGITSPYPDANSTLRFSYGNIKGYVPREAEFRTPFTTMKGMLEKDTGVNPFDMPQNLKALRRPISSAATAVRRSSMLTANRSAFALTETTKASETISITIRP